MKQVAVHIIGDGAIGSAMAVTLSLHAPVFLFGRNGAVSGRRVLRHENKVQAVEFHAKPDLGPSKGIFCFAVKAYSLQDAVAQYSHMMASGSVGFILCNGYIDPDVDRIIKKYTEMIWIRGVVQFGVTKDLPNQFTLHTQNPRVLYGRTEFESKLQTAINSQALLQPVDDVLLALQQKLFANLVINTLAAAYNLAKNADVLTRPAEWQLLCDEAFALINELYPSNTRCSKDEYIAYASAILSATQNNMNSMVVDLRSKKPTEVDYLSGIAHHRAGYPTFKKLHRQILASLSQHN